MNNIFTHISIKYFEIIFISNYYTNYYVHSHINIIINHISIEYIKSNVYMKYYYF